MAISVNDSAAATATFEQALESRGFSITDWWNGWPYYGSHENFSRIYLTARGLVYTRDILATLDAPRQPLPAGGPTFFLRKDLLASISMDWSGNLVFKLRDDSKWRFCADAFDSGAIVRTMNQWLGQPAETQLAVPGASRESLWMRLCSVCAAEESVVDNACVECGAKYWDPNSLLGTAIFAPWLALSRLGSSGRRLRGVIAADFFTLPLAFYLSEPLIFVVPFLLNRLVAMGVVVLRTSSDELYLRSRG